MQGHEHHVAKREERQGAEPEQVDGARAVVAAEESRDPPELHRLVESQPGEHFDEAEEQRRAVAKALEAVVEAGGASSFRRRR